ncbi:MAG: DUF2298 domain-containing protein [Methanocorpusculum sp.]|nr:DUF2298 domain-containing protein [Methanocorpusculum sp.]
MAAEFQALTVLLLLVIVKFCQLAVYPYLRPALPKIYYGLAYPVSILLLTLISWYLGLLQLPVQLALIPFAVLFGFAIWKKQISFSEIKSNAVFDVIFLAGFVLLLAVRFAYPGIIPSGEKFMDAAFLGSIMNNPVVTPADPWLGGAPLTVYYYLGHWMCGVLGILAFGSNTVVFNLMLPLVFGLAAVSAYSVGACLFDRRRAWIPTLVLLIPNIALFVRLALGEGITTAFWNSTRVIGSVPSETINEYPLFSFIFGDPHAHVLGCFNQLLFICLLTVLLVKWREIPVYGKYLLAVLLSLSLGTMPAMNAWDVLVYAPLYLAAAGVAVFLMVRDREGISLHDILPLVLVPFLSILSYAPYLLSMFSSGVSSIDGIGIVSSPSALPLFLGVWGILLFIVFLDCMKTLKKYWWLVIIPIVLFFFGYGTAGVCLFLLLLLLLKKDKHVDTFFAAAGCILLILMEIFYLNDYMGDPYERMNTVFKIGFVCWFILGSSAFMMIGRWIRGRFAGVSRKRFLTAAGIVYLAVIVVLTGCALGFSNGNGGTLDGAAWMSSEHPSDALGIAWLKEHAAPSDVVAEAAGTSYQYSSRISALTGLTTPLGWAGHEMMWRPDNGTISEVSADLKEMYENPARTVSLMDKHNVKYLFVGEVEQANYQVSLPDEGLLMVFSTPGCAIYQRV